MVRKTKISLVLSVLLLLLAQACTKSIRRTDKTSPVDAPLEVQGTEAPPNIGAENLPVTDAPATPPSPTLKDVQVAAYIDSIGFDAFAAIGFMQELEKAGIKPVKIVGTGFGCWAAVSWALESGGNNSSNNSGNRAEWQSFKWSRWDLLPQKGLLNRIKGAIGAEDRFSTEVAKQFQAKRFTELQLPADCPLIDNQDSYALHSARDADISHVLWLQLLHPALGVPEDYLDDQKQLSGAFAALPKDEEWDELSRDVPQAGQPVLWLYLKTRTDVERHAGVENLALLGLRPETTSTVAKRTANGNYWMPISINGSKRPLESLKAVGLRRKFLLDGRKAGRDMLASKKIEQDFSQLFAPPADAVVAPSADPKTDSESH